MISIKNKITIEKLLSVSLSFLLHGLLVLVFLLVEIKFPSSKEKNSILLDIKTSETTSEKVEPFKSPTVKKKINPIPKTKTKKNPQIKKETIFDTTVTNKKEEVVKKESADSTEDDLKFAATLLDTFLVRHPEYARYILQQQAKRLAQNKKMFTRYEIERKINDELHEYIQKNFPEGSEHAMSPYGGPGMQIPIDGMIDAIKKIFE